MKAISVIHFTCNQDCVAWQERNKPEMVSVNLVPVVYPTGKLEWYYVASYYVNRNEPSEKTDIFASSDTRQGDSIGPEEDEKWHADHYGSLLSNVEEFINQKAESNEK